MKTTLVIMAAGIGSRFGEGIKQLAPIGPNGEIIMDYSIYDAKEAGFDKVIFVIRKDLEKDFKEIIGDRIGKHIEVDYVFQELENIPSGFEIPKERIKPWGTGQAVLACKDVINEPFAVINADDYYGKESFVNLYKHLQESKSKDKIGFYDVSMVGFVLGNTLSDNGTVTRGICNVDKDGYLNEVVETGGIEINKDGKLVYEPNNSDIEITTNSNVSMNMWGFTPDFFDILEKEFINFLQDESKDELKKEYLLPILVDKLIKSNEARVKMLTSNDRWFGITYAEDKKSVIESFKELIDKGLYDEKLWK